MPVAAEYEPGAFYKRELPCLLAVLATGPVPDIILIDGYVWLADNTPGLGGHLHALTGDVVIGVAKTRYASATAAVSLCRGTSRSPLYITAAGVSADKAAEWIGQMHGDYRVPTLIKRADNLARRGKGK